MVFVKVVMMVVNLAALSKLPGMLNIMELGYVGFLKIRPQVQAFFVKK
jgi:hypothetical protein